jgi:hypothetical protein
LTSVAVSLTRSNVTFSRILLLEHPEL